MVVNLASRKLGKHEGPQNFWCQERDSKWEPPRCTLQYLLFLQICLVKHSASALTHCMQFSNQQCILLGENAAYAAEYNKFIQEVSSFLCTSVSTIHSLPVSFFVFFYIWAFCPKPAVVFHINLTTSLLLSLPILSETPRYICSQSTSRCKDFSGLLQSTDERKSGAALHGQMKCSQADSPLGYLYFRESALEGGHTQTSALREYLTD